jgi:hypothetical protein
MQVMPEGSWMLSCGQILPQAPQSMQLVGSTT